ncbi:hypothetical protein GQ457_06G033610 [Hibiscus cannabinus]
MTVENKKSEEKKNIVIKVVDRQVISGYIIASFSHARFMMKIAQLLHKCNKNPLLKVSHTWPMDGNHVLK